MVVVYESDYRIGLAWYGDSEVDASHQTMGDVIEFFAVLLENKSLHALNQRPRRMWLKNRSEPSSS